MPTHKWTKYSRSVEEELRDHKVLTRAVFNRDINKESDPIARNSWKKFMSNLRASSDLMIIEAKMKCPVSQRISSAFSVEGVDADSAMATNILSWEKEPIRCLQQMLKNVEGFADEPITLTALAELTGVEGYPTDAPGRRENLEAEGWGKGRPWEHSVLHVAPRAGAAREGAVAVQLHRRRGGGRARLVEGADRVRRNEPRPQGELGCN